MAEDKKTSEETDLGSGYTDDTLVRVVEGGVNYKQKYSDLANYIQSKIGGGVISSSSGDLAFKAQAGELIPNAIYVLNDLLSANEYFLFRAIDTNKFDPRGIYYPIGINGLSVVPAIEVMLATDQLGDLSPNIFDYFYEPINNNKFYGYPYAMGDTSGTRQFFDKLMGLDGNYTGNVVEKGVYFENYPSVSNRCYFGYSDSGYTFGDNVILNNVTFEYSNVAYYKILDNSVITNCYFSTCGMLDVGFGATITNVRTSPFSGTHYFPANSTTKDGVVGGRGCSAEFETVIDLAGGDTLDLTNYPLCKTYHIANVKPLGLNTISGWDTAENHGAEILIICDSPFQMTFGMGNLYTSSNMAISSGGTFAAITSWVNVLLNHDGNAYATDYI